MEVMKKGGCIVMTIDGPKGPREIVGIGTIKLAQQMGVPILIYGLSANAKRLNTWDRLLWPKPFARGAVVIPEPIQTSKSMDSEELRLRVETRLRRRRHGPTNWQDSRATLFRRRHPPRSLRPNPRRPRKPNLPLSIAARDFDAYALSLRRDPAGTVRTDPRPQPCEKRQGTT
jgi:hypothetical protein